jgi:hypothetical protein
MHPAFIVSPMLISGIALFGSAVWIQSDRNALIDSPQNDGAPIRATISALQDRDPVTVREEELEPAVVELDPIEIVGRRRVAPKVTPASVPAEVVAEPCSSWTEIGPERVTDGTPLGTRRVRELCTRAPQAVEH